MQKRVGVRNGHKIYYLLFALLVIGAFLPAIFAYTSNVLVFFYFIYKNKGKLIKPFPGMKYLYAIIIVGAALGIVSLLFGRFEKRDYIRDLYYFSNPVIVILNGANIKRKIKNDNLFFNTIIVVAGIQAVYYLLHAGTIIVSQGFNLSFRNWRLSFGDSSAIAATAVVLYLIDNKKRLLSLKRSFTTTVFILSVIEIIVSMSRTNILLVLMTTLTVTIQRGIFSNVKKWLKYIGIGIVVAALAVVLLGKTDAVTTFIEKILTSITEINSALDWSNTAIIQGNWRGYETHSAIVQFSNYPVSRQLFGYGFGERIEVGIYAYRFLNITNSNGTAATTIPVLHNGYSTMLCKLGILGIVLYLAFYVSLIRMGRKKKGNKMLANLLVAVVIAMIIETYILNGLFRENINYPFIYMIGYLGYSLKFKEKQNVIDGQLETILARKKVEIIKQT